MNRNPSTSTPVATLLALAIPVIGTAQKPSEIVESMVGTKLELTRHHRYKLVDLGPFAGGARSYSTLGSGNQAPQYSHVLNDRGGTPSETQNSWDRGLTGYVRTSVEPDRTITPSRLRRHILRSGDALEWLHVDAPQPVRERVYSRLPTEVQEEDALPAGQCAPLDKVN